MTPPKAQDHHQNIPCFTMVLSLCGFCVENIKKTKKIKYTISISTQIVMIFSIGFVCCLASTFCFTDYAQVSLFLLDVGCTIKIHGVLGIGLLQLGAPRYHKPEDLSRLHCRSGHCRRPIWMQREVMGPLWPASLANFSWRGSRVATAWRLLASISWPSGFMVVLPLGFVAA